MYMYVQIYSQLGVTEVSQYMGVQPTLATPGVRKKARRGLTGTDGRCLCALSRPLEPCM